jgi:hypothetical protein
MASYLIGQQLNFFEYAGLGETHQLLAVSRPDNFTGLDSWTIVSLARLSLSTLKL